MIKTNLYLEKKKKKKQKCKGMRGTGRKGKYGQETTCKEKIELHIIDFENK